MLLDFVDLKLNNSSSMYQSLYEQIKTAVHNGKIKSGERLPSIREASKQLDVSRTTVENAYMKLCIEGVAESLPQRGYYICKPISRAERKLLTDNKASENIKYDFSTQKVDPCAADADSWKRQVRGALRDFEELTSYGDPQGELCLRSVLATYAYKARGVRCAEGNIVIGAGIGPLLGILCGLIGRNVKVGIENGKFSQAEQIFSDYEIEFCNLPYDGNGATIEGLEQNKPDVLFLLPSALGKISIPSLSKRRNEFLKWINDNPNRLIIEDDYNGELRYTARSVSAFQGKCTENTVYIGSFSKLLLPSVRIAYMVLPDNLAKAYNQRKRHYNQTCGKIEQLALKSYIESGELEKHLRRLRKLYYEKSCYFCKVINEKISAVREITLYETSLMINLKLDFDMPSQEICDFALKKGIKLIKTEEHGTVGLCFAGIAEEDINPSITALNECLTMLKKV